MIRNFGAALIVLGSLGGNLRAAELGEDGMSEILRGIESRIKGNVHTILPDSRFSGGTLSFPVGCGFIRQEGGICQLSIGKIGKLSGATIQSNPGMGGGNNGNKALGIQWNQTF